MFDTNPDRNFGQSPPQHSQTDDTPTTTAPAGIAVVTECHCCGYEHEAPGRPPARCPKCGASSWTRFARLTATPEPAHTADHRGPAGPRGSYRRPPCDRPTHHIIRDRGHAVA